MPKIYLAGPMTGLPELNFPSFNHFASVLRAIGHEVVNPAEINGLATEKSWQECMRDDIRELVGCDAIALLPGWQRSTGANLELHIAHRLGMDVLFVEQLVKEYL
ncbi:DUF4406 domain-containing protein [Caldimonas sp. KR1-144]|uniref:DUF4406 domain-containing protein n=1 Tax=Caldimonas sp. KR1-144 TaxID=3400911 RepID=UPI003BFAC22B